MMSKIDYLTLLCGEDILLRDFNLIIHQPKIKEISLIGEESFFKMASFLSIDKQTVIDTLCETMNREEVESVYKDLTDYEIFYSLASVDSNKEFNMRDSAIQIFMVLFPDYNSSFEENGIYFITKENNFIVIDKHKYSEFREYIKEVLGMSGSDGEDEYNPVSDKAKEIAEKLKARKKRLAKNKEKNINIIANYVSSLSIGVAGYNLEKVSNMTLYQVYDQMQRYSQWRDSEFRISMQLAGAKDVENKDWYGELK